jgi:hypothetical protein
VRPAKKPSLTEYRIRRSSLAVYIELVVLGYYLHNYCVQDYIQPCKAGEEAESD